MTNELIFQTNSSFNSINYDKDGESWHFLFEDKIWFTSSGFWRLLVNNKIVCVSLDNGHQFGLPQPLDLIQEVTKLLEGIKVIKVIVDNDTADLKLIMTDEIKIEIFISSSGYETYEFSIDNKRYIGLGAGEIAMFDNN